MTDNICHLTVILQQPLIFLIGYLWKSIQKKGIPGFVISHPRMPFALLSHSHAAGFKRIIRPCPNQGGWYKVKLLSDRQAFVARESAGMIKLAASLSPAPAQRPGPSECESQIPGANRYRFRARLFRTPRRKSSGELAMSSGTTEVSLRPGLRSTPMEL